MSFNHKVGELEQRPLQGADRGWEREWVFADGVRLRAFESKLRRGWCWGPKSFREELLELIGEKQGRQHYGSELRESDEQKAGRLVNQMLRQRGLTEAELGQRKKSDWRKAAMAARLRQETRMSWEWIAQRLAMGHWRTASNAVRARQ